MSAAAGRSGRRARLGLASLASGLAGASIAVAACGTAPPLAPATGSGGECLTTVHGVVQTNGALVPHWLPAGFTLSPEGSRIFSLPAATYMNERAGPNSARLELTASYHYGPLTSDVGGGTATRPVMIRGQRGLVQTRPAAGFLGAYWKPGPSFLVSVVGYRLPAAVVVRAARHLAFSPPRTVTLPVTAGPIVTRAAAIAAAIRSAGRGGLRARAKLSSWTEVSTLVGYASRQTPAPDPRGTPWRPVWAVLVTRADGPWLVVVDAATGRVELSRAAPRASWFSALTDRDLMRPCPGASTARLPFGVLTRTEERYATGWRPAYWAKGTRESTRLVLSTVPAVNRADPSMFGGCVMQNCTLRELVWVVIATSSARPGHRLTCQPPSSPVGFHRARAKEIFTVSVPDNYEFGCGRVPAPIMKLKDLAPPTPHAP